MKSYGSIELTEASPAQSFTEILTLADVRTFCRITEASPADAAEDAMLEGFIAAAREVAEIMQGRDLIGKQYDLHLDEFPEEIELRQPLISVDLIRYRDSDGNYTDLVEGTDFIVDTARGLVVPAYGESWPSFTSWPSSPILVRFTSGYSASHSFWSNAGERVKAGMLMLIEQWYDERIPFSTENVQELPFAVTALLSFGANNKVR